MNAKQQEAAETYLYSVPKWVRVKSGVVWGQSPTSGYWYITTDGSFGQHDFGTSCSKEAYCKLKWKPKS